MPNGFGFRGGRGFGFRGASPPWPYVGRGRGGLPRCAYPGLWGDAPQPYPPEYEAWGQPPQYQYPPQYPPQPTKEEELNMLRDQAQAMKGDLTEIERRIQELEGESGSEGGEE